MKYNIKWHYAFSIVYFLLASIEIIAELFSFSSLSLCIRILQPTVLGLLYFSITKKHNPIFYLMIFLWLCSNVLFYYRNSELFFYGILIFILLRILSLIIIFKGTKEKNYLHITVATFPFLVIFFYLISAGNDITELEFNTLVLQSILISVLAGISITNYIKEDNRQHSWLLISTLLFIGLRFIVFIERFIVSDLTLSINRPIGVILSTFAFFTSFELVPIIISKSPASQSYFKS